MRKGCDDQKHCSEWDEEGEDSETVVTRCKVAKYLYRMCNCYSVARPNTVHTLQKRKEVKVHSDI